MFQSLTRRLARRAWKAVPPAPAFRPAVERLDDRLTPAAGALHMSGNQLLDAANNPVVLRGVNVPSLEWRPDGYKVVASAAAAARDWHANLIRLPVNQDYWFGHNQAWTGAEAGDGGAAYRTRVDQTIAAANAAGAYVVLDLHWSDQGAWGSQAAGYNQHQMPDDNSVTFWKNAAPRYANNPMVLFDLYNEPHIDGRDKPTEADYALWRDGGTVTDNADGNGYHFHGTYHTPGMQGLLAAVRGTGATNVVAAEGLNWGADLGGVAHHALTDPLHNLMYSPHLYVSKLDAPGVAAAVDAVGKSYPIYAGEWADTAAANNARLLSYFAAHPAYNWTAWAYTDFLGNGYNLLTSMDAGTPTPAFGQPVKDALAKPVVLPPAAPTVTARFDVTQDWGSGFTGYVHLTNTGTRPVTGWTLEFDFAGRITNLWDATVVSHVGTHYVVKNVSWDATIGAGLQVSFGFNADWPAGHAVPANYVLNGSPIPAAAPTPTVTAAYDAAAWTGGFTGGVRLVNTGTAAVHGWTLEFDSAANIYSVWNAVIVSHVGTHYVLKNAAWDADIAPGQSVSFGYNAFGDGFIGRPTNLYLNGAPVSRI